MVGIDICFILAFLSGFIHYKIGHAENQIYSIFYSFNSVRKLISEQQGSTFIFDVHCAEDLDEYIIKPTLYCVAFIVLNKWMCAVFKLGKMSALVCFCWAVPWT